MTQVERILGVVTDAGSPSEPAVDTSLLGPHLRDLIERAVERGWTAYIFSSRDVLKQRKTIWGWTRQEGHWSRSFFPIPHIGLSRVHTLSPTDYATLDWLRSTNGTQFINQPEVDQMTNDRWRLWQVCLSHPSLARSVPDAFLLRDRVSLEHLLTTHSAILATARTEQSPARSAVIHRQGAEWLVRTEQSGIVTGRRFRSIVRIRVYLTDLLGEVLLQPYVEPLRIDDCPVGVRVVWQRDGKERWVEGASIVRIGQPEALGSVLATAGTLDRFLPLLKPTLGKTLHTTTYQLQAISKAVIELLDHRGHGAAELAVDFMLTTNGQPSLRGVTPLGGVLALRRLADPSLRQAALERSLDYAEALYHRTFSLSSRPLTN